MYAHTSASGPASGPASTPYEPSKHPPLLFQPESTWGMATSRCPESRIDDELASASASPASEASGTNESSVASIAFENPASLPSSFGTLGDEPDELHAIMIAGLPPAKSAA